MVRLSKVRYGVVRYGKVRCGSHFQKIKMDGYCMRCKRKVEMKDVKTTPTKKGTKMNKGKCVNCGTAVCCISK